MIEIVGGGYEYGECDCCKKKVGKAVRYMKSFKAWATPMYYICEDCIVEHIISRIPAKEESFTGGEGGHIQDWHGREG